MSLRGSNGQFLPGTHWRPHRVFREKAYLLLEYVDKGRSKADIAREHGVSEESIAHWMNKHGIPARGLREERALAKHPDNSGPNNPMFGRTGASNPRYVDGSSPERQRLYANQEWKAVVKEAYARDGYKCQRCGAGHTVNTKLHAHHLAPWSVAPALRLGLSNLVTLCDLCHRWVHSRSNVDKEWIK